MCTLKERNEETGERLKERKKENAKIGEKRVMELERKAGMIPKTSSYWTIFIYI